MGIFKKDKTEKNVFKMVTMANNSYFAYDGKVYQSDLVRSCLRPYVKGIGKTVAKHIFETVKDGQRKIEVNPRPYIRFLLEEPNPFMTFQKLIEKTAVSLKLNGNAFILIARNADGIPEGLYPIPAAGAETLWLPDGELGIRFYLNNGKMPVFRYSNLIHLRGDYGEHDIFGDSIVPALQPLMDEINTIDNARASKDEQSTMCSHALHHKPYDHRQRSQQNEKNPRRDTRHACKNVETKRKPRQPPRLSLKKINIKYIQKNLKRVIIILFIKRLS